MPMNDLPVVKVPDVKSCTLPNGLGVLVSEDHALPIVCSTVWYKVGARDEPPGLTGVSHFLEHLMFKGAKRFPKGAIDEVTLRLGGHDNAFTSYDYTGYYFAFASDRWQAALDIEADRMHDILLDRREFSMEKQVVLEELSMGEDSPWEHLRRNVATLLYRRHPYRNPIIGWKEDLEGVTRAQVASWYRRHYHPANALVVVTGDVAAQDVFDAVGERFGALAARPVRRPTPAGDPPPEGLVRFTAERPSNVARLMMLFQGPSVSAEGNIAVNLLQYILSEGKTSRIHKRLVEDDQTVSGVSFHFEDMMDAAPVGISAQLKAGVAFEAVEEAVFEELRKVAEGGVTEQELARARRQMTADFIFDGEDIVNLAVNLGVYECLGSYRLYTDFMDHAAKIGPGEIQAAAARIFGGRHCVVGRMEVGKNAVSFDLAHEEEQEEPEAEAAADFPEGGIRREYRGWPGGTDAHSFQEEIMNCNENLPAAVSRWARPPCRQAVCGKAPVCPVPAANGPRVRLDLREYRLDNGVRVLLCPIHRIPAIYASAAVLAGGREDPAGLQGRGYMLGHLLDEGTPRHNHEELAAFFDDRGGVMESFASREGAGITLKVLGQDFPQAQELLREMIFESCFPADRVEHVRAQVLNRIASMEDRPDYLGSREYARIIFEGTPLAHPLAGYRDTVAAIDRDHLMEFHRRWYTAANTLLVLVGDFEPEAMIEQVRRVWANAPEGEALVRQPLGLKRQTRPRASRVTVAQREQRHLYLGHLGIRRADPDYYKLLVMDVILGGGPGFTSRIPRRLRDEMGLAYTTWAGIASSAGPDEGSFTAYIGTSPDKRDAALEGMMQEIRRIRNEPVSAEELSAARDYLTGSFVFKFETLSQVASFLVAAHLYGLGFDYIDRYAGLVAAVTAEDVQEAAIRHIDPDAMTLVEAGA